MRIALLLHTSTLTASALITNQVVRIAPSGSKLFQLIVRDVVCNTHVLNSYSIYFREPHPWKADVIRDVFTCSNMHMEKVVCPCGDAILTSQL